MKIPKRLKIGAITYDIRISDKMKYAGIILRECNLIKIKKELSKQQREETFFHELVHAINWEMDEKEVELFAQALYQVFSKNNLLK
jgi:DNA-directed RNA polymerase delta subunit